MRSTLNRKVANYLTSELSIQPDDLVIFSACDSAYVQYAVPLIKSLDIFSPGFHFILHVVNPTEQVLNKLSKLSCELNRTALSVTYEKVDLEGRSDESQKTYYACARFIRLSELLESSSNEYLVLDADSLFINFIDRDFTDKQVAEICIRRRDQTDADVPMHLAVATGTLWCQSTPQVRSLINEIASSIEDAFDSHKEKWFLDQISFSTAMYKNKKKLSVYNIKSKYADWSFNEDSIIWAAKGEIKNNDLRFKALQNILLDTSANQLTGRKLLNELNFKKNKNLSFESIRVSARLPLVASVILPRLDLPWKQPSGDVRTASNISADTVNLRLNWKEFTVYLGYFLEKAGILVETIEVPAWEINSSYVDSLAADLVFVPHRCADEFQNCRTPVFFYMQEFFRWVFTVDRSGWSAASSRYPFHAATISSVHDQSKVYDSYKARLEDNNLASKFSQHARLTADSILQNNLLSRQDFIFFPLQIPHDQSITKFSEYSELEVLEAVVAWCRKVGKSLIIKEHPANRKSADAFKALYQGDGVYWSDLHVYDLIEYCEAVFTINSGVGLEALFFNKPVITFGRVEYDCVTHHATPGSIQLAWEAAKSEPSIQRLKRIKAFMNEFFDDYAVDLSRLDQAFPRLETLAHEAKCVAQNYVSSEYFKSQVY